MMIDSHCHFDAPEFDADRDAVFQRALKAGVRNIISPAITAASWPRLRRIAAQYPGIYPCYGLHPMFIDEHQLSDIRLLAQWIETETPVAVGEIGLDFYQPDQNPEKQRQLFAAQLDLASQYHLPVIIHARKSVDEVIHHLSRYPKIGAVLHSYSGSAEQAHTLRDREVYFGFGGPVSWEGSTRLQRTVKALSLDRILLETDAPDQTGRAHRGERNEPGYLPEIAAVIAKIKGVEIDDVINRSTHNSRSLFNL